MNIRFMMTTAKRAWCTIGHVIGYGLLGVKRAVLHKVDVIVKLFVISCILVVVNLQ
jgi:hypothetical protein